MKNYQLSFFILCYILCSPLNVWGQVGSKEKKAALQVIERVYPQLRQRIKFQSLPLSEKQTDRFEQRLEDNHLIVEGSSAVALCKGTYDFIRNNGMGICSWSGNRLSLPASFDGLNTRSITSPFAHHYYFNVVTYGYTMPYWDWQRWEAEIDWMALHGIDMPLALVANEAISARVWKKMGLTDAEIANYFVGPAHLPWMRMGNISGIDGPMPKNWHKDQIALQHKILKRMRSLGMHPICPGFAGFVPKAMKRLYPNVKISETSWGGAFHNWMLSPEEELFHTIGQMFIEEWEKEFGRNTYYLVDSFNEMDIPFPPKNDPKRYSLLASYGDRVYQSIKAGNPDAVWVMQGWMFGYQRHIWDYPTLQALVSKVPDDKMLLLDLAVDYNKCFWNSEVNWDFYKGFYNKPWVYSVIPNMGGKSGMTGILDFYANGHLEALNSPNKGRLVAHGMAPEGIENNEVIYELLTDAGWSDQKIDIRKWLAQYSLARYGKNTPALDAFWDNMLQSVYGSFTDHPRYNWQLRPGLVRKGTIRTNAAFFAGIEALMKDRDNHPEGPLFNADLREWEAAYLGGKLEWLSIQIEEAYNNGDTIQAKELQTTFVRWMKAMDALLYQHPTKDLQRWIDFARIHGENDEELSEYYEKNARRIVTIWGPPVDDYSARIWSGLIRDYYLPRWQHYFQQKQTGTPFDFAAWERNWVEKQKGTSTPQVGTSEIAQALQEAQALESKTYRTNILGSWATNDTLPTTSFWGVSASAVRRMKGIKLTPYSSSEMILCELSVVGDGKTYPLIKQPTEILRTTTLSVTPPDHFTANNECQLKMVFKTTSPGKKANGKKNRTGL